MFITADSEPGRIISGNDMYISAKILNDKSFILAGGNLQFNHATYQGINAVGTSYIAEWGWLKTFYRDHCRSHNFQFCTWRNESSYIQPYVTGRIPTSSYSLSNSIISGRTSISGTLESVENLNVTFLNIKTHEVGKVPGFSGLPIMKNSDAQAFKTEQSPWKQMSKTLFSSEDWKF